MTNDLLKYLYLNKRYQFTAEFDKIVYNTYVSKKGVAGVDLKIQFKNVCYQGQLVMSHTAFTYGRGFSAFGKMEPGDKVSFAASVYQKKNEDGTVITDIKVPTQLYFFGDNSNRLKMPNPKTDEKALFGCCVKLYGNVPAGYDDYVNECLEAYAEWQANQAKG